MFASDSSVIQNCSINHNRSSGGGGGIGIEGLIKLSHCWISDNRSDKTGAGVSIYEGSLSVIQNCRITKNGTGTSGGGISIGQFSEVLLLNTSIDNNAVFRRGGGAMVIGTGSETALVNCVIYGNKVNFLVNGPFSIQGNLQILNSIIWNNQGVIPKKLLRTIAFYSNIEGISPALYNNNIDSKPLFVDPKSGDFHLKQDSPCIDAGHPDNEYRDIDGTRNDMGVYGGPEVSNF